MNVLLKFAALALLAVSACFIYVAVAKPPQFSFMGMQFGRVDDHALATRDDLERIDADLRRLSDEISELGSAQKRAADRIESIDKNYVSLSNDLRDKLNIDLIQLNNELSELGESQNTMTDRIDEIDEKSIKLASDIRAEVDKFTVSMLKNMPYVNMFPHELVAVMGAGARDPLKTIDENVSYIKRNQPDLFNYPGIYVCPPPDPSQRTWNVVYGNYTTSAVADRIRLITARLHGEMKQRPAYPYPKSLYHPSPLSEACVDGNEWVKLGKEEKIALICKFDSSSQESLLTYCENSDN